MGNSEPFELQTLKWAKISQGERYDPYLLILPRGPLWTLYIGGLQEFADFGSKFWGDSLLPLNEYCVYYISPIFSPLTYWTNIMTAIVFILISTKSCACCRLYSFPTVAELLAYCTILYSTRILQLLLWNVTQLEAVIVPLGMLYPHGVGLATFDPLLIKLYFPTPPWFYCNAVCMSLCQVFQV